jgi:dCTP diphosphatase
VDSLKTEQLHDSTATISLIKLIVERFVQERGWESFHSPKSLSMSIAIEAAELMEHFQWTNPDPPDAGLDFDSPVAQELADVLAYTLALANVLKIDLSQALESKMASNRLKYPVGAAYEPKSLGTPDNEPKSKKPQNP